MDFVDHIDRIRKELKKGVRYIQKRLNEKNYQKILKEQLKEGDIFIDLSYRVDTRTLIDWCHHNDVLFLNTAVEHWEHVESLKAEPSMYTLYSKQMELRELTKSWGVHSPTAIVDHGANPDLVSHFTKEAASRDLYKSDHSDVSIVTLTKQCY
jgi:homospermidine synthase